MTRTFLVAVNLTDTSDLAGLAEDIHDDLATSGHDVESVKPWGSSADVLMATLPQAQPLSLSPVEPAQTQNLET